ncbi:MAG: CSLREA domain-containing protein [Anaerolineae bacterium]|nr:CSLREA domain-containing protein [Anaerolineae bacterium]
MYIKRLVNKVSHLSTLVRVGAGLLLVTLALGVWPMPVTHAAPPGTITVDTTSDELDGLSGNGDCSLREAIANANHDNAAQADCATGDDDDDVIILDADTYILDITGAGEDGNTTGDLDITGGLIINGNGAIIQAGTNATDGIDRVLDIDGVGVVVEINDATIRYGHAPDGADSTSAGGSGEYGGGITVLGTCTLTLNRSTVTANSAGNGGNASGSDAPGGWGGRGGGIYVEGTLVLNQSTVSGNYAGDGGTGGPGAQGVLGGPGGGIATGGSSASVTLNASLIAGNSAGRGGDGAGSGFIYGGSAGDGGGIYVYSTSAMAATNSTISGNSTGGVGHGSYADGEPGSGGGVINHGSATFTHCTFAQNAATDGGTGNALYTGGTTMLANTILASGDASNTCAFETSGTNTSNSYNIDDGTSCGLSSGTDLNNKNPNLAALAANGGPTLTHALQSPSDVIERIPDGINGCDGGTSVDQRGAVRAGGSSDYGGTACEVGAYEYDSEYTPTAVTLSSFAVHRASGMYVMLLLVVPVLGVVTVLLYRRRSA